MVLLLWLLLLLSCMITYIHYCCIIIVITMLIMIVYHYVYKRLQQFLTCLTGLRKGLVTVNVHFMYCSLFSCVIFVCMCVRMCAYSMCCLLGFCMSNVLSCLLLWNLFYGVHCFHVFSHIYIRLHHHCYELCKALRALGIEHCIRCSLLLLVLLFILLFVFDVNLLFRDGTLSNQFLLVHCTALSGVHSVAS